MKAARQLSAENLAEHYKRLETETVASTQVRVVSQLENSGGLYRTSDVSQSYRLQEAETVARSLWSDSPDSQRFPVAWIVHLLFLSNCLQRLQLSIPVVC